MILDEACGGPVLTVAGGSAPAVARSDAALLEPKLLLLLTKAWRQLDTPQELTWEADGAAPQRGSLWALALRCAGALVRDDARAFNRLQAGRAELLRHLLLALQERLLGAERAPTRGAGEALLALVRALMGAPPDLRRLKLLADFLLLVHQVSRSDLPRFTLRSVRISTVLGF